ncbi:YczE/YyaS/YitT family protein [Neobacillus sp. SM06]|uniref:YczE/YyaS/YitT family protein n=1 Tax=Neobacillus sp. SM06 TaxID=3422492 RepID=UPI003D2E2009
MLEKRKGQLAYRFAIYFIGLLIMALGIVFLIKSRLGATPWDVFHVGLYDHLGLTIGSWSILVGFVILGAAAVISKEIPHIGAFLNMLTVGIFIDLYMMLPFMVTPESFAGKMAMFLMGILLNAYGMGIYISASLGAGPRDSLMLALTNKTGWKVRNVRAAIEIVVLLIGWKLGGPANWGTILFGLTIGPMAGIALPQCDRMASRLLKKASTKQTENQIVSSDQINRGVIK